MRCIIYIEASTLYRRPRFYLSCWDERLMKDSQHTDMSEWDKDINKALIFESESYVSYVRVHVNKNPYCDVEYMSYYQALVEGVINA